MDNPYLPVFAIAVAAVALLMASLVDRYIPFFNRLNSQANNRFVALDGFRGFLAIGVFIHHCAIFFLYKQTSTWRVPPDRFFAFLGNGSVAYFFMITGFLFWSKARLSTRGIGYGKLLPGRFKRILPMYLASYVVMLGIVCIITHGKLLEPAPQIAREIFQGSLGGAFGIPTVNGRNASMLDAGVTWSLRYEWLFYLALPLLSLLVTTRRRLLLLVALYACSELLPIAPPKLIYHLPFAGRFLEGMIAAEIYKEFPKSKWLKSPPFKMAAICLIGVVVSNYFEFSPFISNLCMLPLFVAVVYGFSGFGLLNSRPAQTLGHISYSVYLTHGIILNIVFWSLEHLAIATAEPLHHWLACCATAVPVVLLSSLTFRFIEWPFIKPASMEKTKASTSSPAIIPNQDRELISIGKSNR